MPAQKCRIEYSVSRRIDFRGESITATAARTLQRALQREVIGIGNAGVAPDSLDRALSAQIELLVNEGVTEQELARAQWETEQAGVRAAMMRLYSRPLSFSVRSCVS